MNFVLTLALLLLTFFKTIRRISGKRLINIRRIMANHVDTEDSIWANTKYILCCLRKGLEWKENTKWKKKSGLVVKTEV